MWMVLTSSGVAIRTRSDRNETRYFINITYRNLVHQENETLFSNEDTEFDISITHKKPVLIQCIQNSA